MILVIDNYDSFTYNLVAIVRKFGPVLVIRSDQYCNSFISEFGISGLIISPGPGKPIDRGFLLHELEEIVGLIPILGVCLGFQMLAQIFGGKIRKAMYPMHGKTSLIKHNNNGIFYNLPNVISVMRYHSLIIENITIPKEISCTAWSNHDELMAYEVPNLNIHAVQFHPESILTYWGEMMIENWLRLIEKAR